MPTSTTIPNCRPNCSISRTLRDGFALSLRAEGKSPKTLKTYLEAIDKLLAFVQERGMPELPSLTAEHLREFFGALYAIGNKPATVSNRYRALKRFFSWLREEGEVTDNPLTRIKSPHIPSQVLPHYAANEIEGIVRVCNPNTLSGARNKAIVLMLLDTGMRASELLGLDFEDIDFERGTALVRGKGGKQRMVSIGSKTALALNRYLRFAQKSSKPMSGPMWLSERRERLGIDGLRMLVTRAAKRAGVQFKGIHSFRRTSAIAFLEAGGYPDDLQTLMGWSSSQMLRHYTKATATERAVLAHKRLSPSDRLSLR